LPSIRRLAAAEDERSAGQTITGVLAVLASTGAQTLRWELAVFLRAGGDRQRRGVEAAARWWRGSWQQSVSFQGAAGPG
jgi:hypothetical protein